MPCKERLSPQILVVCCLHSGFVAPEIHLAVLYIRHKNGTVGGGSDLNVSPSFPPSEVVIKAE